MPWVYSMSLTGYREASEIEADWESVTPGGVRHANGGSQVHGNQAAIVSQRRNPEYENMESLDYVLGISEDREVGSDEACHLASGRVDDR